MANEEDRLSALTDEILRHIVSFLDTKSAIRTTALSEQHRRLRAWTSLSSLDFRFTGTRRDHFEDYITFLRRGQPLRDYFENYVTAVLQQREPSDLRSFRLSEHGFMPSEFTMKCIDYAVQHRVQHLRLRVVAFPTLRLPHHLLTSTFLRTLRLNNATAMSIVLPMSVSLPNLKGLHLNTFAFSDNNDDGQFFCGCPNLENLVLIRCWINSNAQLKNLNVNCPNLTSLEIRTWRGPWECFDMHVIDVFAPGLLLFKLQGQLVRVDFKSSPPCSLKQAYIDLSFPTQCSAERRETTFQRLAGLLHQINKVGFLSLLSKTDELLSARSESLGIILGLFENWEIVEVRQQEVIKNLKRLFWPYPM